ncbi:hypothetical protein KAI87_07870 [Myxococcota bacterium]|nr:hypothetical protein [Myxococcota bacterium]
MPMTTENEMHLFLERLESRLDGIENKIDGLSGSWRKSMQWLGMLSEHVQSHETFRDEVRESLEPLFRQLENFDDSIRVMRHATSDVSRRMEEMEAEKLKAG